MFAYVLECCGISQIFWWITLWWVTLTCQMILMIYISKDFFLNGHLYGTQNDPKMIPLQYLTTITTPTFNGSSSHCCRFASCASHTTAWAAPSVSARHRGARRGRCTARQRGATSAAVRSKGASECSPRNVACRVFGNLYEIKACVFYQEPLNFKMSCDHVFFQPKKKPFKHGHVLFVVTRS